MFRASELTPLTPRNNGKNHHVDRTGKPDTQRDLASARAEGAMTPEEERSEIARIKRINRIGAFTVGCMCTLLVFALVYWLFR